MFTLTAQPRTENSNAAQKELRASGRIPAIVYGPKQESTPISVPYLEFVKVLRDAGESQVVTLQGIGSDMSVLIHEVDMDPVRHEPRHADFYAIEKGAKVQVALPITFVGEAPATKNGGNLVKVMHELEIEAAPDKLPQELEVDVSTLENIGDQIHVSDLKLPAGVTVLSDAEEVIVLVQETVEEPEEDSAAPDMSAIEVEAKGKADTDESGEDA